MTISGTQNTAALPAAATTANRSAATPASGDHGTAAAPAGLSRTLAQLQSPGVNTSTTSGGGAAAGAALTSMPGQHFSPFDRIQSLLRELMLAIRQLNQPISPYPPIKPPHGPYPPIEPPHVGCPHMDPMPPIDPWMPPPPPTTKRAPEVGDVLGTTAATKGAPAGDISVKSVHGTYKSRDKAVAAAKHLSGIFGDKPFGVAVSGVPGQEKYTVVGLTSTTPLKAAQIGNIIGQVDDGWALDTIAFSAKTAKRIPLGLPTGPDKGDVPPVPDFYKYGTPAPPAPPVPVPAPAPAPHTH